MCLSLASPPDLILARLVASNWVEGEVKSPILKRNAKCFGSPATMRNWRDAPKGGGQLRSGETGCT
jgi:hypothetical protein